MTKKHLDDTLEKLFWFGWVLDWHFHLLPEGTR